jgi:hypothetical protein
MGRTTLCASAFGAFSQGDGGVFRPWRITFSTKIAFLLCLRPPAGSGQLHIRLRRKAKVVARARWALPCSRWRPSERCRDRSFAFLADITMAHAHALL